MKCLSALSTATLFAARAVAFEALIVNNPGNVAVCKPFTLTWSGGTPPYAVSLDEDIPNTQTADSLTQLVQFESQNGTSFNWVFDLSLDFAQLLTQVGDSFVLKVVDGVGESNQSTPFNIQDSTDHSCIFGEPSKPKLSKGEIVGICLGVLGFLTLLLVVWRVYILHTRRRLSENFRERKNLGIDQNIPLSPVLKQGIIGESETHA
ncbi:hypothetical protein GALMADRAFT_216451 [Galerina marginata CBS 339.88]|uniref:Mid2 domain-containing protein n=1 Tax=Galerina marginata (strain CBS 339.88) TaxID=685588 RepID=A0A067S934_GALM3|nr:hypothetical protein GALMADRAFT_216451 [Galerina marginata CBS 339.88]